MSGSPQSKDLKCISLFSGCGGLDLGCEDAGFRICVATDKEPSCAASYTLNRPNTPYLIGAIGQLTTAELLTAAGLRRGEADLLVGGPPCPAFSKSRFYRTEKPRALEDQVAAETISGFLRVLKQSNPKAFLLENVKGLTYKVHRNALEHIIQTSESLGYHVGVHIANAADYGVPQIRERCFVIGSKFGFVKPPLPTHGDSADPSLFGSKAKWRTAGEVLSDLDTEENASDTGHFAGGKFHDLLRRVPPGDNYLFFTKERGCSKPLFRWRSRYWSFLLKLSPDLPSWTIQARRSNNMGPFHWRNRILRIEEVKRLQTFPDSFTLSGSVETQWRQLGNAVPPLLARHFVQAIKLDLEARSKIGLAA